MTEYSLAFTSRLNNSLLMCMGPSAAFAFNLREPRCWACTCFIDSIDVPHFVQHPHRWRPQPRLVFRPELHGDARAQWMPSVMRVSHSACAGTAKHARLRTHAAALENLTFMRQA